MKKVSFFIAAAICLLLCNVNSSFGQYVTPATATVNVILADVESIMIESATQTVNLNFSTAADYAGGVSSGALDSHLKVVSTSPTGFIVNVKAGGDQLVNGTDNIPVADILLTSAAGTGGAGLATGGTLTPHSDVSLTTADQAILSADKGTSDARFAITYATDPSKANDFVGKTLGTYTQTVTYSIVAQ